MQSKHHELDACLISIELSMLRKMVEEFPQVCETISLASVLSSEILLISASSTRARITYLLQLHKATTHFLAGTTCSY
jgi:hypothetical protein